MANKVLGMHRLKNKVNRNAFDLSHRHMFTAQVGELLPVFTQWVNPNETFKIGYNGKTRTAALNTDAFTRIRENIQYYFVPFQSLWKYFEQQVNNMIKGDSGQNISKFASSSTDASQISTSLPYISYFDLGSWLAHMVFHALSAISTYFRSKPDVSDRSAYDFARYCSSSQANSDIFICDGYRYCRAAKLLMALGYGNFDSVIQYDIYAMAERYVADGNEWSTASFQSSDYFLKFNVFESSQILNSPNLSILPLLAYHKICNDHYRNEKWQPFEPWTCNIDYLSPTDNMNAKSFISSSTFTSLSTSLIDLENSNLPIDYFTSVLPRAQYGDESAVSIGSDNTDATFIVKDSADPSKGVLFGSSSHTPDDTLVKADADPTPVDGSYASWIRSSSTGDVLLGFKGNLTTAGSSLKISALRSATALQKYKEIQNSNDPDFANQVLAHFGIKPKVDARTSIFIGGDDKTLSINPQVNTNFVDGGQPDIKAIGVGDLSAGCKFTSTTYGMIIGIYRAVPQLDYSRVGIDRNLFKTDATDFPIPELDSIGMQTQFRCELSAPLIGVCKKLLPYESSKGSLDMSVTYGYAPRYAELKSARDCFEGGFCGAYSSWVTGYDQNFLSLWRRNLGSQSVSNYGSIDDLFKCRPSLLYPIFVNQWSGTVNDDKLLIGSVNTCVAVRPFSMYGLPYSK
uniref:Major capsid protein n=1 Tax=Microviridae sp. ct6ut1 TaxID=2824986 RepID=A0A8S5UQ79_9VIRU|nr:MAG TPA: Major capsid protein [Microviridae sp. ct6ut1]